MVLQGLHGDYEHLPRTVTLVTNTNSPICMMVLYWTDFTTRGGERDVIMGRENTFQSKTIFFLQRHHASKGSSYSTLGTMVFPKP